MKVAIPIENDSGLDALVCKQFEKAPYFAIVNLKGEEAEIGVFENPATKENKPGLVPEMLSAYGVKKVFVGEVGTRLKILFDYYGIEIISGASGTLQEAVRMLLSSSASQS
jgi:predicted Fe-Mo cluster-binding NifX family protein